MSDNYCPSCDSPLPAEAINISEGVALCPGCGKLNRLSDVVEHERPSDEVLNNTPSGCSLINQFDETVIRISLRSFGGFLGTLFFCLFWNAITGVFVLIALAGLYKNLIGPLPTWFPAPDMNGSPMGLGMTLFLCLFLTPFVTVGLILLGAVLLSMGGSLVLRINTEAATIKTGVGPFGWTQRFNPQSVQRVSLGKSKIETNGKHKPLIEIEADRTIRFGSTLSESRRDWLIAVLRRLLIHTN